MSNLAIQIHEQAIALFHRLPVPNISPPSARVYEDTLLRMLADDIVDPLRPGDARDTYNVRRAALHAGTWRILQRELTALAETARVGDRGEGERALAVLARIVERCGPAIERDPPADRQVDLFERALPLGDLRHSTSPQGSQEQEACSRQASRGLDDEGMGRRP